MGRIATATRIRSGAESDNGSATRKFSFPGTDTLFLLLMTTSLVNDAWSKAADVRIDPTRPMTTEINSSTEPTRIAETPGGFAPSTWFVSGLGT